MALKSLCIFVLISYTHGFKLVDEFKIIEHELNGIMSDYKKATRREEGQKANDQDVEKREDRDVADAIINVNLKTDNINMLDGGDMIFNIEQKHQHHLPAGVQANLIRTTANYWNKSTDSTGNFVVNFC